MRFSILGPLEVVRDGEPLPLGGHRQRAVLARLLVDANRVVSTDALVDGVWGESAPATAVKTLHKYVSELRKALEPANSDHDPAVLVTRGRGYRITVDSDDLDSVRFERLAAEARTARSAGDLAEAAVLFAEALALWRGPALGEFIDEPFAPPERTRLDEVRVAVLEEHLETELALGRHRDAAVRLVELVEEHPLRERLWALLMLALYRSGRQAEALRAFARLREILREELGLEPSEELKQLELRILTREEQDGPPPRADAPRSSLPAPVTSFIGREWQLEELRSVLEDARLVTLTGVGGAGKTRLAIEVAMREQPRQGGGALLVDLAPITDATLVPQAVADVLDVPEQPGRELIDVLADALSHRPPALLIVDNCEHLLTACAELVESLLPRCPGLRLLVTSRQALGVRGEHVWPVPPFDVPAEAPCRLEELHRCESVNLFVDRARLAVPGFALTEDNRDDVAAICRHLDGVPLALELAASQVRVLEPAQISGRLSDRFRFLGDPSTTTGRSGTLLATVEWSYQLLSDPAQALFDRLSVFAGSFTLEAAEALGKGVGGEAEDTLRVLTELVDKSLVVRGSESYGNARYRLLETLRMYGDERLRGRGLAEAVSRAHALHYLELARAAEPHLLGPDERTWAERLEVEDHNLRAALAWARAHDVDLALRLAVALSSYWYTRFRVRDALTHLEPTLAAAGAAAPSVRAAALTVAADLAANWGEDRKAAAWAEEAITLYRRAGNRRGEARAQLALGSALRGSGQLDRGSRLIEASFDTFRELGDARSLLRTAHALGDLETRRGNHERAEGLYREALDLATRSGSTRLQANALWMLGAVASYRGDAEAAVASCRAALALLVELSDRPSIAHVEMILGDIARREGDDEQAVELYEKAMEQLREIGDRRCIASALRNLAVIATRSGDPGRAEEMLRESLGSRHDLGDEPGIAECLEGLAAANRAQGRCHRAATMLAAADAIRASTAVPLSEADRAAVDEEIRAVRSRLDPAAFDEAWALGSSFAFDESVDYCRTPDPRHATVADTASP